jgi:chromosome segregation ATPase
MKEEYLTSMEKLKEELSLSQSHFNKKVDDYLKLEEKLD